MIDVKIFEVNPLQENCYVVSDDTRECVVIDCGAYFDAERKAIVNYLHEHQLRPVHLLCTHGHFDHNFGNDTIYTEYGIKPEIHADDASLIADLALQCEQMGMGSCFNCVSPPLGTPLADSNLIGFGNHQLKVIHTPGHSPGGVLFYCQEENIVFTGDTLFRMSVGRTDLPGGSWADLIRSLQTKVASLPADTVAYPGHGPKTLIADECKMNPYFR